MVDRDSQIHRLELAIVGHVLLNPTAVRAYQVIHLSPAAANLLDLIIETPAVARVALLSTVRVALDFASAVGDDVDADAVMALAEEVAALKLTELAEIGTLDHAIRHLRSLRVAELRRRSAA